MLYFPVQSHPPPLWNAGKECHVPGRWMRGGGELFQDEEQHTQALCRGSTDTQGSWKDPWEEMLKGSLRRYPGRRGSTGGF